MNDLIYADSAPISPPGTPSAKATNIQSPIPMRIDISKITNFGPLDSPPSTPPPLMDSPFSPAWGVLGRRTSQDVIMEKPSLLGKVGRRLSEMSPHRRMSTASSICSLDDIDEMTASESTKGHLPLPLTRAAPHVPRRLSLQTWRSGQHAVLKNSDIKNRILWTIFALGLIFLLRTYTHPTPTTVVSQQWKDLGYYTKDMELNWTVEADEPPATFDISSPSPDSTDRPKDEVAIDKLKELKGMPRRRRNSDDAKARQLR